MQFAIDTLEKIASALQAQMDIDFQRMKEAELQLSESKMRHKILSELKTYIKKAWPQHILNIISKDAQLLNKLARENEEIKEAIESLERSAKEHTADLQHRYPALLDAACKENNMPLDRESRDPKYTFEGGFFTLELNYQRGTARLFDNEGKLAELPYDVGAVIECIQKEHKRVFGGKVDSNRFLKKLRSNYVAILKKEGWSDGYAVPIRRITARLGKNEKGFRTDEFIVQLSRLIEQGPNVIENRILDLQQTKDPNLGIYLHGVAGRGYIGYITFKEGKKDE